MGSPTCFRTAEAIDQRLTLPSIASSYHSNGIRSLVLNKGDISDMPTMYDSYRRLRFDWPHPRVLRITMDNGRMNTADAIMHAELVRVWRDVDADESVNCAMITGAGKTFSAGGDFEVVREI